MSCIVFDIGNTDIAIAQVEGRHVSRRRRLPSGTRDRETIDSVVVGVLGGRKVDGAIISSVVPAVNRRWGAAVRRQLGCQPLFVSHELKLGVGISYPRPERIGADRLANACAAVDRYGAPAIVADFGTALTFDVVDATGTYVGGVIAPGLPFMTDYLAEKTALLPHIRLQGRLDKVGRSTEGAMRIGAKIGYRGMVREIVGYLTEGIGGGEVHLCATGGFAEWALQGLEMPFSFNPDLTLIGIGRIFELNTPRADGCSRG